jgi:hypothetical protein
MKYIFSVFILLFPAAAGVCLPGEWQELNIAPGESVWADSSLKETLRGEEVIYGPEALFDGDYTTPWVEGEEGSGAGEGVTILTRMKVTGMSIVNGFALSERLFLRNNRLKSFSISYVAGLTAPGLVSENDYQLYFVRERNYPDAFEVEDNMDKQYFSLFETEEMQSRLYEESLRLFAEDYPDLFEMILDDLGISSAGEMSVYDKFLIMEIYGFFALRITIEDVYPGTHYDDTCVSEIELTLEEF